MIFEKDRPPRHEFYIYNTAIEVVNPFKYMLFFLKTAAGIVAKN